MRLWDRLRQRLVAPHAIALLVGAGVCGFLVSVVAPFLVRRTAESAAAARGLEFSAERVGFGFFQIHLHGVSLKTRVPEQLRADFEQLSVAVSPWLKATRLEVNGGQVRLLGSWQDLKQSLQKSDVASGTAEAARGRTALPVQLHDVNLDWQKPDAAFQSVSCEGLSVERAAAELQLGCATLNARRGALTASAAQGSLALELGAAAAANGTAGATVRLKKASSSELRLRWGSIEAAAEGAATDPTAAAQNPSGAAENWNPASVWQALAQHAQLLSPDAELDVEALHLELNREGDALHLGPYRVSASRTDQALSLQISDREKKSAKQPQLRLSAAALLDHKELNVTLAAGPVALADLGVQEQSFGLIGVSTTQLTTEGQIHWQADSDQLRFDANLELSHLSLQRAALAAEPLRDLRIELGGRGALALDGSNLELAAAHVQLGQVRLLSSGAFGRSSDGYHLAGSVIVPPTTCQNLLEAVPITIAQNADRLRLEGDFSGKLELAFDSQQPDRARATLNVLNRCRAKDVPFELSTRRFARAWTRQVENANHDWITLQSGPGSENWVNFEDISPHMETAIIVCEDGRFLRHHGFDYEALADAITDNLRAGRFMRGASTVSMQLAKNLYLTREKTLARKIKEAVLTLLVEQELSKPEILELYLNVIEFGPGLYGIGPAARRYFQKTPRDLSLAESLYLASILPNPEHRHLDRNGQLSPSWAKYLERLMHIARKIRRITDEELEQALLEPVVFEAVETAAPVSPAPAAEPRKIRGKRKRGAAGEKSAK